jgi:hypothetical protein
MFEVENAITAPFEDFDLVVETFHKAAILSLDEVVGNFLPLGMEQFQEIAETIQAAFLNPLYPMQHFRLSSFLGQVHIEDGSQLFAQDISLFSQSGMLKEASQDFSFFLA